ncbi:hypothetical protein PG997_001655 [Apiospora hydei]|uniref:Uncharacterized protein n=1 Tax=Apiospora hydei TaxID=1337664 RepID=A0ABR1XE42_9PEZI
MKHKLRSHVSQLLRTPGHAMQQVAKDRMTGFLRGTVFLSSAHDHVTLSRTTGTLSERGTTNYWHLDMCERAFLREEVCRDFVQVLRSYAKYMERRPFPEENQVPDPDGELLAGHITVRLPQAVIQQVQRIVHLPEAKRCETGDILGHVCGEAPFDDQDWRRRTFKGAREIYTDQMFSIPAEYGQGPKKLIEWERVEHQDGRVTFKCLCNNGHLEEAEADDEHVKDEIVGKSYQ